MKLGIKVRAAWRDQMRMFGYVRHEIEKKIEEPN